MKDKGVMPSKIISRNWVLKRKRKKLPYGPDLSSIKVNDSAAECEKSPASGKGRQKTEIKLEPCSSKRRGNDGYYYECVICDLGGDLLCCDTCPRTYHLECLDPPLKSIPNGKWECPQCCEKRDLSEPSNHQEIRTKRARTRVLTEKSKAGSSGSDAVKVPPFLGSSGLGKKRSSTKKKAMLSCRPPSETKLGSLRTDVSCSSKSRQPSHRGSLDGSSASANGDGKKKCDITPSKNERTSDSATIDEPSERTSNSQVGEELSLPRAMDLVPNDETSGKRPGLSNKVQSDRNDLVAAQARKRKLKVSEDRSKKKSKTISGKISVNTFDEHKSRACASRKNTKVQRKGGYGNHGASTSKANGGSKGVDTQKKHEKFPQAVEVPPNTSGGVEAYEAVPYGDTSLEEPPQVDRVLGCRMHDQTQPSHQNSLVLAVAQSSGNQHNLEIKTTLYEVNPLCLDATNTVNHSGDQNVENHFNEARFIENEGIKEKIQVPQRSLNKGSNELKTGDLIGSTEGQGTTAIDGKDPVKSSSPTKDSPICCLNGEKMEANKSISDCGIADKMIQDTILAETSLYNEGKISHEFLVKWVGKSHIHNSWISESMLKALAKRKLDNYKAKYGTALINVCDERWMQLQRVISLRPSKDGTTEAFVKWSGLPYDECTWERIDEPVIENSLHLIEVYKQFERNTLQKDGDREKLPQNKDCQQNDIPTLTEQPKELRGGSLFPHQLEALNWLRKCWYRSKNVILADEMGLGKTVSACAFISSLYFEFKAKLPCLVLVPLSTMPNWMAEFALWAPDLNVVEYHGCAKARNVIRQYEWHANYPDGSNRKTELYKFNVLLTTYEMVLADSSHLRGIPWEVLLVDEGHRLKNSGSKLFSLLNTFSFQHRVLLTGTPLQNNIGEMYNLLNFLQPASFPSLSSFEEKFKDLTTAEKVEELKKLVAPHMLRRLKKDAMQNIPPKTERMVPVELSSIQAEYYRAMLTKNYQILRNIGKGVPQQSMLNIVMQLRKVCNHPYLIPGTEPDSGSVEFLQEMRIKASAKLTLLHSMLKILHKEGHRVLVFSQMTKLLDILEDYLTIEFGPKSFERVDGSVSVADRQAAIARYNQDKSRFIFLLSTRSCGLGINLATADTVIIYDSDFNPHADIQAMNRAHRIGQSNRLLVYRLVVRASVEERILQLAKKKLMLDQLFVNKSGSQKEVEDILRWGTEELFSDSHIKGSGENEVSKAEAAGDAEHKSRRRTGGLGDVYKDKCTEGSSKIIWDENAILKLLDRLNLESGSSDNLDGDLDNDMLGSVKSVEWNDEPEEEEGRTESPLVVTDDASAPSSEKKEDNLVIGSEENEWDKLLRVRWEKYQIEEEAALGRGKRLRKAVSYREVFASHPNETLSESGGDDAAEPEPEPQREYTPAGRALKEKFARLRTRQKERLAWRKELDKRKALEGPILAESLLGHELVSHFPLSKLGKKGDTAMLVQHFGEKAAVSDRDDNQIVELEVPKGKIDAMKKGGRLSKHKLFSHQNLPVKLLSRSSLENAHPSQSCQGSGSTNSVPGSNFLPVLGLCAPNACQAESLHRNSSRSYGRESKQEARSDFPGHSSCCHGTPTQRDAKGLEAVGGKLKLPVTLSEAPQQHMKNSCRDNSLPFPPYPPLLQGNGAKSSGATSTDFLLKMGLPSLPFDEKLLPRFAKNFQSLPPNFFPSLSLGKRDETANGSVQMPSTVPLLPKFKFPLQDLPNYNQHETQMPTTLSLGQMPNTPFSDSHRKVLESIMLRAGTGSSNSLKRKSKIENWSEDELDSLWIGVRRHGWGNWDVMLRDPRLKFAKHKTQDELAARWEEEQLKILDAVPRPKSQKLGKSNKLALFPFLTDGMMTHALHDSKLGGPFKFQSHLTDIKLGFGDPDMSHFEPSSQGTNETYPPFPTWGPDKFSRSFPGDNSGVPPDRQGTSSSGYTEPPLVHSASGASNLHPLSVNCSGSFDLQHKDDELGLSRSRKLPCLLDQSLNLLHECRDEAGMVDPTSSSLLPSFNTGLNLSRSKGKEIAAENSSQKNNLPHWLRDAVSAPVRHPHPELPPTVSAIAESVRLLYAEQKPTIPPFVVPSCPPSRPKDPRKIMKKKRRQQMLGHFPTDISGPSQESHGSFPGGNLSCGSIPTAPPFPMLAQPTSGALRLPSLEPNRQFPDVNMMNRLPSSLVLGRRMKVSSGLYPCPEVLQLVASYAAPGSNPSPSTGMNSLASIHDKHSLPQASDQEGRGVTQQDSPHEAQDLLPQQGMEQSGNADSSKIQVNSSLADQPEVEEISSEETVSDDHEPNDTEAKS